MSEEERAWPEPPAYRFANSREVYRVQGSSITRLCGTSSQADQCFWRRIAWSPDGTHLLAQSDDHHVDVFRLATVAPNSQELALAYSFQTPTTLLAMEWYPFARFDDAPSWCFAISARDVPIRLIDAYEGRPRASYGIVDHVERFIAPQALAFSLDGTKLYGGHNAEIYTFDLSKPGNNTHGSLRLTPTRKAVSKGHASAGQRGQVSTLSAMSDHFAGTSEELVAVGTFAGTVGIYHMGSGELSAEERCLMGWSEASAGVTQLAFHPAAPHILFVTSRRSDEIRAYDLQYVGSRRSFLHPPPPVSLLAIFSRSLSSSKQTQQRLGFHLDWAGRYLMAGDAEGVVQAWDIALPTAIKEDKDGDDDFFGRIMRSDQERVPRLAAFRFQAAKDAVASVVFHPTTALIAVASGARHWPGDGDEEDQDQGHFTRDGSLRLFAMM